MGCFDPREKTLFFAYLYMCVCIVCLFVCLFSNCGNSLYQFTFDKVVVGKRSLLIVSRKSQMSSSLDRESKAHRRLRNCSVADRHKWVTGKIKASMDEPQGPNCRERICPGFPARILSGY